MATGAGSFFDASSSRSARRWAAAETVLIFLVFFLAAGWPAPDVNEAHYFGKAKHFWNPAWCAGDFFLESADAHQVFNWTVGWLTLWFPLPAAAWAGRVAGWGLLAWGWRRLSVAAAPGRLLSVLSAGLFVCLLGWFSMAGEWVVGGVEGKLFSYGFVMLALEALVRGRWRRVWLLLGLATSFHALVGGWSVVAAGAAWWFEGRGRPSLRSMAPALAGGLLLAAPGLLSGLALTWGVDRETVLQADMVYVYERLKHHLVFHEFPGSSIARHIVLLGLWGLVSWRAGGGRGLRRLQWFVGGAAAIAAAGAAIDGATLRRPEVGAPLLRYYWFRLCDAAPPIGVSLGLVRLLKGWEQTHPGWAGAGWAASILAAGWYVGAPSIERFPDPLPGADLQGLGATAMGEDRVRPQYEDWRRVCGWISRHTAPGACFITPRRQQTFKWYAGRAEVATWKDVPQNAMAIVQWRRRLRELAPIDGSRCGGPGAGDERIRELAKKYGAQYIVVDLVHLRRRLSLPRVYPNGSEWNEHYEVYWAGPAGGGEAAESAAGGAARRAASDRKPDTR